MQANITERQHSGGLLSEPHFDDEATLLSARPVVPLHEVKAVERSRRRLGFGLALVAALVVGAFGATLIYRQRGEANATVDTTTQNADLLPAHENSRDASGGTIDEPASVSSASTTLSDAAKSEPRDAVATPSAKPVTSIAAKKGSVKSTEPTRDAASSREDEAERLEAERAQRRADRLETRRQKREARRESWGEVRTRRVQRGDDLLRIREIFEGPRRPPRSQRWQ